MGVVEQRHVQQLAAVVLDHPVEGDLVLPVLQLIVLLLDRMVEDDGRQLLYMTLFNYAHGNLDDVRDMLLSPNSVIGLSDAGAHCGAICDGSFPTTAVSLWTATGPRACRSS